MSFFGKKFKRTKAENVEELWNKFDISDNIKGLFKSTDSVSSFTNNGDGTITFVVSVHDKEVYKQVMVLNKEVEFTIPDGSGQIAKSTVVVEGETLKSTFKLSDGKVVHMDRTFSGNTAQNEIWVEGFDGKAKITYAAV